MVLLMLAVGEGEQRKSPFEANAQPPLEEVVVVVVSFCVALRRSQTK